MHCSLQGSAPSFGCPCGVRVFWITQWIIGGCISWVVRLGVQEFCFPWLSSAVAVLTDWAGSPSSPDQASERIQNGIPSHLFWNELRNTWLENKRLTLICRPCDAVFEGTSGPQHQQKNHILGTCLQDWIPGSNSLEGSCALMGNDKCYWYASM